MTNPVCTPNEVFTFMGTATDVQTNQGALVTALIDRATAQFQQMTGRSPILVDNSSVAHSFFNGSDCDIFTHELYLDNEFRDIYEISEIKEDGTLLSEIVSAATQNNDYVVAKDVGKISRPWGAWLKIPGAIEIKGRFGLITKNGSNYETRGDVKQIIIEMVAALSGLWKQTMITEGGQLQTTRLKITEETQRALDAYKIRPVS